MLLNYIKKTFYRLRLLSIIFLLMLCHTFSIQSFGGTCASNVLLDDQERQFVAMATDYFNQIIQASAKRLYELWVTYYINPAFWS